ncbi:unnamed protein product [Brachionus calyciflorus]|uniref:Uncharacterized protein n=1 Tax=Brachionus calyciflorus TaxID=104777 RepID=A0A814P2H0_9BILA|nr:unnamed protein product [Brachionus calyciflorus]
MFKDVENFKKQCKACIRNENANTLHHPAISNLRKGLYDEISIDFVWGLDETVDGFKGVMIIEEQLGKHVEIYWPAHRILSDNEPAFISEAINHLKTQMGVEWHKTVAIHDIMVW